MESPEAFPINGMSSSSLDGGLTKSLLDSASLSSALDRNSIKIGSVPFGLDQISTLNTAGSPISLQPIANFFDDSLLFNQPSLTTSVSSQAYSNSNTNNNSTTNFDPLTGNIKDAPLVSITSNGPLNDSLISVGKFGDFDGHEDFQLTIKDANGNLETFSLIGDGEGEVFRNSNFQQVIFKDTNASTAVQISAFNNIKFGNYIGSSLQVQTKGSIITSDIVSNGGAINLNSYLGSITTIGNITNSGGDISLTSQKGLVTVSGTLDASSLANGHKGGTVQVLGNSITLLDQAQINVSGNAGGGTALIGGDYQGKGTVLNAQNTFVSSGVKVNADAVNTGDGGKVIVWSDNTTRFLGNISARGGSKFGNGGTVEVSGKQLLDFKGTVYANAINGLPGTLLLDPKNIIIADADQGNSGQRRAAYISDPFSAWWGSNETVSNQNAMSAVFGTGNWDNLSLTSAGSAPFATSMGNGYKFIFLEGGDNQATNLSNYLATNSAVIDAWVKQGGHLFINAAPNVGSSFSLGFGVTLNYPDSAKSVVAANSSHPIFNNSLLPTGTTFSGDDFSHATVSGGGITPILLKDSVGIVLGEKPVGKGLALFGGMTNTNFHSPQPQANNLLTNIIQYAGMHTFTPWSDNAQGFTQNPTDTTTITPSQITDLTNSGMSVYLQANNDIKVNSSITTIAGGNGGALTLQAGRSILINANITTDNGDLTLSGNDSDAVAAQRSSGTAVITMANGTMLNAGKGMVNISLLSNPAAKRQPSGDVRIGSIIAKQVDILSDGGVNAQGNIETDNGDVNITAIKNIIVKKITSKNGGVSLISGTGGITANGEIDSDNGLMALAQLQIAANKIQSKNDVVLLNSSQGGVTVKGAISSNSDISVGGFKDVVVRDVTSFDGSVALISSNGNVRSLGAIASVDNVTLGAAKNVFAQKIASAYGTVALVGSQENVIASGEINSGSHVAIQANQKVTTGKISSQWGTVTLIAKQGAVTTQGDITTNNGDISISSVGNVVNRNVISNGGAITIVSSSGGIVTGYLRSDGELTGGQIYVQADDLVRVTGSFFIKDAKYSIYTGVNQEGWVNIVYESGTLKSDKSTNFSIGNSRTNGTAANIYGPYASDYDQFRLDKLIRDGGIIIFEILQEIFKGGNNQPTENPSSAKDINPITGKPFNNDQERELIKKLSEPQRRRLGFLIHNQNNPERITEQEVFTKGKVETDDGCFNLDLDRHLGDKVDSSNPDLGKDITHSKYATYVTGSLGDYLVITPSGLFAFYDGLVRPEGAIVNNGNGSEPVGSVAEVKTGYKWLKKYLLLPGDPKFIPPTQQEKFIFRRMINQIDREADVARDCGLKYFMCFSDTEAGLAARDLFEYKQPPYTKNSVVVHHIRLPGSL